MGNYKSCEGKQCLNVKTVTSTTDRLENWNYDPANGKRQMRRKTSQQHCHFSRFFQAKKKETTVGNDIHQQGKEHENEFS